MKSLLNFLYFLLFLVVVILLAGLFLPQDLKIEENITIKASNEMVFEQVNRLKNWEKWSPWFNTDTTVKINYTEISAGKGAGFDWKDGKGNSGSLHIGESTPGKMIQMKIDFGEQGDANMNWNFSPEKSGIKVIWIFESYDMGYFERYFMILFKRSIQNDLKSGLKKLKSVCEGLRLSRISAVEVKDMESQPAMVIIDSANMKKMDAKMKALFEKLDAYLVRRKLEKAGNPFTVFFKWDPDSLFTFAVGYPIPEKTWGWREYRYYELPGGKTAMVTHWGRFDSEKPYLELDKYFENHHFKQGAILWEEYIIAPENEPDTSLWEKKIYVPLEP